MVGESIVGIKCIEISDLGIDVELQQERHFSVFGGLPDNNSIPVTIVIPTRDRCDLLERCLEALLLTVDWRHVKLLIVDDFSRDEKTVRLLKLLPSRREFNCRVVRPTVDPTKPFNYSMLVNTALPTLVREAAISESGKVYRSVMARVERPLLRQALDLAGGNQLKAARLLGINRNTLRKRLRLLGLLQMPGGNGQDAEKGPSASLAPSATVPRNA